MLTDYLGQHVSKSYCHTLVFKYFESAKKKVYFIYENRNFNKNYFLEFYSGHLSINKKELVKITPATKISR